MIVWLLLAPWWFIHLPLVINANPGNQGVCHVGDIGTCFAAIFGIAIGAVVFLAIVYFSVCWQCYCITQPQEQTPAQREVLQLT